MLAHPIPEMLRLRVLLTERGKFPSRRTWERRLKKGPTRHLARPDRVPGEAPGRAVEAVGDQREGAVALVDSTVLRARGGVWHKKDREAGKVPHTSIDTEAHWTKKSGWHGWVYGWKLHLATTVAGVWIPLAARLTPANEADSRLAPRCSARRATRRGGTLCFGRHSLQRARGAPAVREPGSRLGLPTRTLPAHEHPGVEEVRRVSSTT